MDVAAVDGDVARQPAEKWDSYTEEEDEADHHDEAADDDKQLADFGHTLIVPARGQLATRFLVAKSRRIEPTSLEPDPADRLFDLRLVQTRDRHAVDHGEGNLLDIDIQVA